MTPLYTQKQTGTFNSRVEIATSCTLIPTRPVQVLSLGRSPSVVHLQLVQKQDLILDTGSWRPADSPSDTVRTLCYRTGTWLSHYGSPHLLVTYPRRIPSVRRAANSAFRYGASVVISRSFSSGHVSRKQISARSISSREYNPFPRSFASWMGICSSTNRLVASQSLRSITRTGSSVRFARRAASTRRWPPTVSYSFPSSCSTFFGASGRTVGNVSKCPRSRVCLTNCRWSGSP